MNSPTTSVPVVPRTPPALVPADTPDSPTYLPSCSWVTPVLTDMYQLTMTYAYWKGGRQNDNAVFDLYFRKNPFGGEFTIFAGLEECIRFVQSFRFSENELKYLRELMPACEPEFFDYLSSLDCSGLSIYAIAEGTVVFPRVPLLRIEGPLAIGQLLETTLLNLTNFSSLICTNAARLRIAAGADKKLLEFGLRRAQGPDGAMTASRFAYMGGFDGTSNVAAGMYFGISPKGTHAHSYVSAHVKLDDLKSRMLKVNPKNVPEGFKVGDERNIVTLAVLYKSELGYSIASLGELAAFCSYAMAFPDSFLALVDTYDTLQSGVPNFICVALALLQCGYAPNGIRLDSGDLAYLSKESRRMLIEADKKYNTNLQACIIVASNDINEAVLLALNDQSHSIDTFGIGTNLVTCQAQPALGMVYKLVEINNEPRIKLSQEAAKITIPGRKDAYRLVGSEGVPILDLIIRKGESPPVIKRRVLCRHPFEEKKRAFVTPTFVIPLLRVVWRGKNAKSFDGEVFEQSATNMRAPFPSLSQLRDFVGSQLALMREDHMRLMNPTPYKVSVTTDLFHYINDMMMKELPIAELE